MTESVVTRFAPSPTGMLHIGGARTALFNWLFARRHQGQFLLRIEDTDRERSTAEARAAILDGLRWLGLDWDGATISQSARSGLHREVAETLLASGNAYRCFATKEELDRARKEAQEARLPFRFRSPWRDRDPAEARTDHVVRLRAPREGQTTIEDAVQGTVTWSNSELDDLVLLRSDGTPTYMLAVVADDHEMGVTHVIRGTDHMTNAARQRQIYDALGWRVPVFAHVPLIHGKDGGKYSKRHGAVGLDAFESGGYLPAAMRNCLARLGWSHGDDEFFTTEQATGWFSLEGIGRSAARFDPAKLLSLNADHMRSTPNAKLLDTFSDYLARHRGLRLDSRRRRMVEETLDELKPRARTLAELAEMAHFILTDVPVQPDDKASRSLGESQRNVLAKAVRALSAIDPWNKESLEAAVRRLAAEQDLSLGKVAQPMRAALTGRTVSPGIFDVMIVLGRSESLDRIQRWATP